MSEPKIISPLLDGFKLGAPIRDQNGIVCRPAIKENSNKKFIVKTISVPANQAQLDACCWLVHIKTLLTQWSTFAERARKF